MKLINWDCLEEIKKIESESIDLIITSPPYNKWYWSKNRNINNWFKTKSRCITYWDFDDNLLPEEYEKQQRDLLTECCRVLKQNWSIFYNHIDILNNHNTIHPKYIYDFPLKQIIIWNRRNTPKLDKSYFYPINEYIFWIKKDKSSKPFFNRKNAKFQKNIWEIWPAVKNNHPAPYPEELVENIILSCSDEWNIVLDPFMWSWTTWKMAKLNNRDFIGIELNKEYFEIAKKIIENNFKKYETTG